MNNIDMDRNIRVYFKKHSYEEDTSNINGSLVDETSAPVLVNSIEQPRLKQKAGAVQPIQSSSSLVMDSDDIFHKKKKYLQQNLDDPEIVEEMNYDSEEVEEERKRERVPVQLRAGGGQNQIEVQNCNFTARSREASGLVVSRCFKMQMNIENLNSRLESLHSKIDQKVKEIEKKWGINRVPTAAQNATRLRRNSTALMEAQREGADREWE